ncbi:MAG: phosphoribosylglycinamide formyltransferase [Alphaproteobacteria bacterium]
MAALSVMAQDSSRRKVGVLISGRGSNLQSLIDACAKPDFPARIALVISNKADAYGLERAKQAGIATLVIDHKKFSGRESFDAAIDAALRDAGCEFVCLAGFMRLLTAHFNAQWHDRMLNIHPSLLPAFKGLYTHERALDSGVRVTGCTVHVVRADMDAGPIVIQAAVPVLPDDTAETLAARVLAAEHRIYPEALRLLAEGRIRVTGDIAIVDRAPVPAVTPLINPPPRD